jgi:hypothetical protein
LVGLRAPAPVFFEDRSDEAGANVLQASIPPKTSPMYPLKNVGGDPANLDSQPETSNVPRSFDEAGRAREID